MPKRPVSTGSALSPKGPGTLPPATESAGAPAPAKIRGTALPTGRIRWDPTESNWDQRAVGGLDALAVVGAGEDEHDPGGADRGQVLAGDAHPDQHRPHRLGAEQQ